MVCGCGGRPKVPSLSLQLWPPSRATLKAAGASEISAYKEAVVAFPLSMLTGPPGAAPEEPPSDYGP